MAAKKTKNGPEAPVPAKPAPEVNDVWVKATGSKELEVHLARIKEISSSIWLPEELSEKERDRRLLAAVNMFAEIKPQNGLEGMLATQMVATHSAAMECLRRAMIPSQTFAGAEQSLKHANKLLQTFARQLEALDKHRGKGQQKITVEHVTVEAGGQAIVGNVTAAAAEAPRPNEAIPMLAHQPEDFMPMVKDITPAKVPVKARRKGASSGDGE